MKRLVSTRSKSNDESSTFHSDNNAFAAAVTEALTDSSPAIDHREGATDHDDSIFEYIQEHDEALETGTAVSMRSSNDGSRSSKTSVKSDGPALPVVRRLSDNTSSSSRSFFRMKSSGGKGSGRSLMKMASVPSNMGGKPPKVQQQMSVKSDLGSQPTDSGVLENRQIPTRQLASSRSISTGNWKRNESTNYPHIPRPRMVRVDPSVSGSSSTSSIMTRSKRLAMLGEMNNSEASSIGLRSAAGNSFRGSITSGSGSAGSGSGSGGSYRQGVLFSVHTASTGARETTRPIMPLMESGRSSTSYQVPMPVMPFETRKASLVRLAMAIIFLCASLTLTLLQGQGQLGATFSSYLYHNLIEEEDQGLSVTDTAPSPGTSNGSHLFSTIREIEDKYDANILGKAEYHTPVVSLDGLELEVEIGELPHTMNVDHYIKYIWIRDVESNTIVLAKEFKPADESPPVLRAKVPLGVTLQPYVYCTVHNLWRGTAFNTQ